LRWHSLNLLLCLCYLCDTVEQCRANVFLDKSYMKISNPDVGCKLIVNRCYSLAMPICRSEFDNLAPSGRIFVKFDIWVFFENLCRKFKFHWNLTRITGTLHVYQYTFMRVSSWILLRMRNVSDKSRGEIKTYFVFHFFSENHAVYEIMWRTVEELDGPQTTI